MIALLGLLLQLALDPPSGVGQATVRRQAGIGEEGGQTVGSVLLICVPDLDLTAIRPEILDDGIEQGGLADPLAPEGDQQQPAPAVSRKMSIRHVSSPW
jgi:hypothetical protein